MTEENNRRSRASKNSIWGVVNTGNRQTKMLLTREARCLRMISLEYKASITIKYLLSKMVWHWILQEHAALSSIHLSPLWHNLQEWKTKQSHCTIACRVNSTLQTATTSTRSAGACLRRTDLERGSGRRWWRLSWLISRKIRVISKHPHPPDSFTVVRSEHGCCHMQRCTYSHFPASLLCSASLPLSLICTNTNYANESTLTSTLKL